MNFSCDLATDILSPNLKKIVIAETTVATISLLPNVLLLSAVWQVTIFPSNLRLLLGHFSFALLYFAVMTIVKGTYIMITSPCSYSISAFNCKIFDIASTGLPLPNIYYSMVAIAIERVYATINYKNYDKTGAPFMAVVMIIVAWVSAFFSNNGIVLFSLSKTDPVPFCDSTFLPAGPSTTSVIFLTVEIITIVTIISVYFYNRHIARNMAINQSLYNLSARFLVSQNVQVNKILLPQVILHFICHLPTFIFFASVYRQLDVETRVQLQRSTYLWRLVYAVIDPLIAFRFNSHLKQHLGKGPVGKLMKKMGLELEKMGNRVEPQASHAATHFAMLENVWKKL